MSRPRAFTLLQGALLLLALAVLVVVLYPFFARPRDGDWARTSCLSNVKQIGLALALYITDNGNRWPLYDNGSRPGYVVSPLGASEADRVPLLDDGHPGDRTEGSLYSYVKIPELLECRDDPRGERLRTRGEYAPRYLSYALNGLLLSVTQDQIVAPEERISAVDECSISDYVFLRYAAGQYQMDALAEPANFVHTHGLNCLYADGHAKWMSKRDWPQSPTDPRFHAETRLDGSLP